MTLKEAKTILVRYNNNGYPTIGEFQKLSDEEFDKWVNIWPPEYLEAMIMFGESLGYKEESDLKRAGFFPVLTVWGERAKKAREVVAYKKTTEGKQDVLRTIAPTMTSMEQRSAVRMKKTKELKSVSEKAAVEKKISKQQAKLNAKRIEIIEAIEHNISQDGELGDGYKRAIKEYHKSVNNLPTNEDAANAVMKSKKRNKVLALIASWFIMPIFVIIRVLTYLLDSAIMMLHLAGNLMSQMGGKHLVLSRIEIPLMMTIFYVTVTEYAASGFFGDMVIGLSEKVGIELNATIAAFFSAFLLIVFIRNIGGIIPFFAGYIYGNTIVSKLDTKFSAVNENDYQMKAVSEDIGSLKFLKARIEGRERIIESLMEAVEANAPYCEIDKRCECKDFSVKYLKKQDRYAEKWRELG